MLRIRCITDREFDSIFSDSISSWQLSSGKTMLQLCVHVARLLCGGESARGHLFSSHIPLFLFYPYFWHYPYLYLSPLSSHLPTNSSFIRSLSSTIFSISFIADFLCNREAKAVTSLSTTSFYSYNNLVSYVKLRMYNRLKDI